MKRKWLFCILIGCISISLLDSCKITKSAADNDNIVKLQQRSKLSSKQTAAIDSLIQLLPKGSEVGISVYDLTKQRMLYTYQDKKLSRPASTMKLITTITTLSYPEGRKPFVTEVWYKGDIVRDTLQGNIYIKGCMDPEFDDNDMDSLVTEVAKFPFKVIHGDVIGDVSMKDSLYWGSGWMWDDAPYDYQPNLSPLMLHKGTVTVTAMPDSIGKAAIITTIPQSNYYTIYNETRSNATDKEPFSVTRDYINQSNKLIVKGNIARRKSADITVSFAPNFFLQTFIQRLTKEGGKTITGSYCCSYLPAINDSMAHKMATCSTDCRAVVKQMLKQSDNLNAEAMFYRLSGINGFQPATAEGGVAAIQKRIAALGLNPDDYNLADGCGLSNYDYLSPELEMTFLRYAYSQPDIYKILYPSLPIAGVDGTLRNRMKGTIAAGNVHAKTGSYTAINALAGYLTTAEGHEIAFSILNQNIFPSDKARSFQDEVCKILCKSNAQKR